MICGNWQAPKVKTVNFNWKTKKKCRKIKKIRASFITWFLLSEVTFDLDRRCHTKYGNVCTWQVTWLDSLLLFFSFFLRTLLPPRTFVNNFIHFFFWYIKTVLRAIRALAQRRLAYFVSVEYDRSLLHGSFRCDCICLGFEEKKKK